MERKELDSKSVVADYLICCFTGSNVVDVEYREDWDSVITIRKGCMSVFNEEMQEMFQPVINFRTRSFLMRQKTHGKWSFFPIVVFYCSFMLEQKSISCMKPWMPGKSHRQDSWLLWKILRSYVRECLKTAGNKYRSWDFWNVCLRTKEMGWEQEETENNEGSRASWRKDV